jgi:uncharacterized repeat protein (TIGR01451 family)
MNKIYQYISFFLLAFITIFTFNAAIAVGTSPSFNSRTGDYKTLRGANFSAGEKNWHDPVSAKTGDTVNWTVYIHNGVEGSRAEHVNVSIDLPGGKATSHSLSAVVSAENTQSIHDTANLSLEAPATLNYIKGSTELYNSKGEKVHSLPDGITSGGIDLGSINGCWQYAVFVVFKTKVDFVKEGQVSIAKHVRNVTKNQTFVSSNTARTQDTLEYRIVIQNDTNYATDFAIADTLPKQVSYLDSSLDTKVNDIQKMIFDDQIVWFTKFQDIHLKQDEVLEIHFQVSVNKGVSVGTVFTNTASLLFDDKVLEAHATTTVIPAPVLGVTTGEVLGATTLPVTGSPITVSLALAFLATAAYYAAKEKALLHASIS